MKFRKYIGEEIGEEIVKECVDEKVIINESSTIAAFFISPIGELINTKARKHIDIIIGYPDKFNLDIQNIKDLYDKYNEKLGTEGKAREKIILSLIKNGWIRIRRYHNKFWVIDVPKMDNKVKDRLYDFVNKILSGIDGFKEQDKYMPVKILDLDNYEKELTIDDISKDKLFDKSVSVTRSRYILTLKEIGDV